MNCHCCNAAVTLARKARLRDVDPDADPGDGPPFAIAFVCQECYDVLNTVDGVGLIDVKLYQIDQASRFGKAPLFNRETFDDYQRREALTLGTADAS
jgi:hypothetical protein